MFAALRPGGGGPLGTGYDTLRPTGIPGLLICLDVVCGAFRGIRDAGKADTAVLAVLKAAVDVCSEDLVGC